MTRFRMEVYAVSKEEDLKEHANASAEDIFRYLRNNNDAKKTEILTLMTVIPKRML